MKHTSSSITKNTFLFIALFCSLISITLVAGIPETYAGSKYERAKKTFDKIYPNAKKVKWSVDDHDNHEAHFKLKKEKYRADFLPNGKWIETEQSIKWSDLPDAIQERVKSDYDKDDIAEIEYVDHHSKGKFYDVEFKQKGKNMDIEYRADGTRIN